MLKTTDSRLFIPAHPRGVQVVPDELVLPIRLRAHANGPLEAARELSEHFRSTQHVVGALDPSRYRSWTEKLAGKSFRGHGVRHHAEALVLVRRSLNDADFFERVQVLETLRATLEPFDDGKTLAVGVAEWRVSNPEQYRAAAITQHKERVHASCEAFGVSIENVSGPQELIVECVNPVVATIQLDLAIKLSANRGPVRAASE